MAKLRTDFKAGDPVRKVANADNVRKIGRILNNLQGVGCRIVRNGDRWKILVNGVDSDTDPTTDSDNDTHKDIGDNVGAGTPPDTEGASSGAVSTQSVEYVEGSSGNKYLTLRNFKNGTPTWEITEANEGQCNFAIRFAANTGIKELKWTSPRDLIYNLRGMIRGAITDVGSTLSASEFIAYLTGILAGYYQPYNEGTPGKKYCGNGEGGWVEADAQVVEAWPDELSAADSTGWVDLQTILDDLGAGILDTVQGAYVQKGAINDFIDERLRHHGLID